jgi:hypothetical protein
LQFDRDFLTREWPEILGELSVPARAVACSGRFLAVEGSAVTLALPQKGHVEAASKHKGEIEGAIARAFGLSGVALFLVVDEPDGAHRAAKPSSSVPAKPQSGPRPAPKRGISDKTSVVGEREKSAAQEEPVAEDEPELDGEPEDPVQLTLRFFPGSSVEDLEEQP